MEISIQIPVHFTKRIYLGYIVQTSLRRFMLGKIYTKEAIKWIISYLIIK